MVYFRDISVKGRHPKLILKIEDKLQSRFFLLDDFANHDLVILAFFIAKPKTKR